MPYRALARLSLLTLSAGLTAASGAPLNRYSGSQCENPALTPSQRAGCQIWFYATAGNGRFHTYVLQQRMDIFIDWFRVLKTAERPDRFKAWGLINDPGCCTPGANHCPVKSLDETYGLDWCQGDDAMLPFVGKPGYRDPACGFKDSQDPAGQRENPCYLEFGASAGVMGLRKFPNPRFNRTKWEKLNGSLGTWKGYDSRLSQNRNVPDSRVSRLMDGSIEPPFLIGMSCGACHIGFDPLHPPKDPANPTMANLSGTVGNQYSRLSEVFASGMPSSSPAWQVFAHARPGTVDTSAIPTDQIDNTGTINAIINFDKRPMFAGEQVRKWRPVNGCVAGTDERSCWCEPGKSGKCWESSLKTETVHHILKGGEDSIGLREAIQRVYGNIGSCSEECWVNHLSDLRQADPLQRNFGQTPFDIGQCRRDCPNFRAIEDRLDDIVQFLLVQRPSDLYQARGLASRQDLIEQLEKEFGAGSVDRGRIVFAQNCARCHSSQRDEVATRDFYKTDAQGVRIDWLGNDEATLASGVGTNRSRALHSNHMNGQIWAEFSSETMRARQPDPNIPDPSEGGRGYYRNVSLLSLWQQAPFMHNNAIGPELCGKPANPLNDFYRSPYVDKNGKLLASPPPCWVYDPSVKGRYELYKASLDMLLNPKKRIPKVRLLDENIAIDIGPKFWDQQHNSKIGIQVIIPAGTPAAMVGNLLHKKLVDDLILSRTKYAELKARRGEAAAAEIRNLASEIVSNLTRPLAIMDRHAALVSRLYMSSTDFVENSGHRFGEDLSDSDKKALTAFLATL